MALHTGSALHAPRAAAAAASRLSCMTRVSPARRLRRVVLQSAAADDAMPDELAPPDMKARAMHRLFADKPKIGAEHGEGFLHYRPTGSAYRLDVDTLNEQLKQVGALRLRHSMHPDEAYGMVFNFDSVLADLGSLQRQAWLSVAAERGLPEPRGLERRCVLDMAPESVVVKVFGWASNLRDARELAYIHAGCTVSALAGVSEPAAGMREWLAALANFNVPCALVSRLDKATVRRSLERMGLHDYFSATITSEDGMDTTAQQLLSAAMRLNRPPNKCVFFDESPLGVTAAHNCTMKAVALKGSYKVWELKAADLTCSSLNELTIYNIRRLFAADGEGFMNLRHEADPRSPPRKRPSTTATL